MAAEVLPSTVDLVVRWAKANTAIAGVFGTNISSSLPVDDMAYPWLQVQRIIGEEIFPEVPIDRARIQFNIWGGTRPNGLPDWAPADLGVRTLTAEIREFTGYLDNNEFMISMVGLEGSMQLVDPDTNGSRFWTDAIITVRNN